VNNAGPTDLLHTRDTDGPIGEVTLANWHRVLDSTLTSAYLVSHHALAPMIAAERGSSINISSIAAALAMPTTRRARCRRVLRRRAARGDARRRAGRQAPRAADARRRRPRGRRRWCRRGSRCIGCPGARSRRRRCASTTPCLPSLWHRRTSLSWRRAQEEDGARDLCGGGQPAERDLRDERDERVDHAGWLAHRDRLAGDLEPIAACGALDQAGGRGARADDVGAAA
jgi:hypothetical protein